MKTTIEKYRKMLDTLCTRAQRHRQAISPMNYKAEDSDDELLYTFLEFMMSVGE